MPAEVQIKCRNIWKIFGENPKRFMKRHKGAPTPEALKEAGYIGAVQDVSFDVHAGEILIIMGLSGSGKSTLIRCITRLNDPTAGDGLSELWSVAEPRCFGKCGVPSGSAGNG